MWHRCLISSFLFGCLSLCALQTSQAEITFLNISTGFNGPTGVDVYNLTGDVYVADLNNGRVKRLNEDGSLIRSFGGSIRPRGVDVGPTGLVFAADRDGNEGINNTDSIALIATSDNQVLAENVGYALA